LSGQKIIWLFSFGFTREHRRGALADGTKDEGIID
jgi:hypothetical protein